MRNSNINNLKKRKNLGNNHLLQILNEKNFFEKIGKLEDIKITLLDLDFFDKVNQFKWQEEEKQLFIREMLALSPGERKIILEDMLGELNLNQLIK